MDTPRDQEIKITVAADCVLDGADHERDIRSVVAKVQVCVVLFVELQLL